MFFGVAIALEMDKDSIVGAFHYFTPQRYLSNSPSSDPNEDHIKKLNSQEFEVPTHHLGVNKNVCIKYPRVIFRIQHS